MAAWRADRAFILLQQPVIGQPGRTRPQAHGDCAYDEVKGWHFVGCSAAIEREAIGPAQDDTPHSLTEPLLADSC